MEYTAKRGDDAMGKREVRCQCGVLNRIPGYRISRIPKCGSCGAALPEPEFVKVARAVYRVPVFIWITGIVFVSAVIWQSWLLMDRRPPAAPVPLANIPPKPVPVPSAPTTEQKSIPATCSPIPLPPRGPYRLYGGGLGTASFAVKTEPGANYLVKLQDAATGANVASFFVYGGQELRAKVPLGRYTLHYAAGTLWCGDAELFGPDTVISEAGQTLLFYRDGDIIHGKIVELILQLGGNLEVHRIPWSRF